MSQDIKEVYDWVVNKSKITDPKDREMISKLENIISNKTEVVEEPEVKKKRGRPVLYTLDQYLAAGLGKKPVHEVARELKVSTPTVYAVAKANGIDIKKKKETTGLIAPHKKSKTLEFYQGHGIGVRLDSEVARDLGITRERVRQIRQRFSIAPPSREMRGERWKVNLDKIESEIAAGKTVSEVARSLGMSMNEVTYRVRKAGIKVVRRGPKTLFSKEEIIEAFKGAKSVHEASSRLGLKHYSHIFRYIDRYNLRELGVVPDGRNKEKSAV